MTEHLDEHLHAFLDENNIVISVNVFEGHNSDLLQAVKGFHGAVDVKCCCDFGSASVGMEFFNGKFYDPKPYPEWVRDEANGIWVAPEGWVDPNPVLIVDNSNPDTISE